MKETKELISLIGALIKAGDDSLKDGKIGVSDLMALYPVMLAAPDAIVGAADSLAEIRNMTPEQVEELQAHVKEAVDLEDAQLEAAYEKALSIIVDLAELLKLRKGI